MALEWYGELTFNGEAVEEDSNSTLTPTCGGEDFTGKVEFTCFNFGMSTPTQLGGGIQSGRHTCEPIRVSWRGTGATAYQWLKAVDRNENVVATFKTFRPANLAASENELAATVVIANGRIIQFMMDSADILDPESAGMPMMCHAVISYHTLALTTDGGEHEISWERN